MYNKIIFPLLGFYYCAAFAVTAGISAPHSTNTNQVVLRIRKDLYCFFSPKMGLLKAVRQTSYDPETSQATCILNQIRDTAELLDEKKLVSFLDAYKVPGRHQKLRPQLVLTAFVKLEEILDTNFIIFDKNNTGLIRNPLYAPVKDTDIGFLFDMLEQSGRICAKIAGIPFLN
ncbi:hypothetical protein BH09DEP1_BH09DEP1_4500 [soil metagenome]